MITVKFSGGLGNQMFEYAFYYSLQKAYSENYSYSDKNIDIDLLDYYLYKEREGFVLKDIFDIELNINESFKFLKYLYFGEHLTYAYIHSNNTKYKNCFKIYNYRILEKIRKFIISRKYTYLHQPYGFSGSYHNSTIYKPYYPVIYDPKFFHLNRPKNFYLDGLWQNCNYFVDYSDELLNKFRFKNKLNKKNKKLVNFINKSNSVSIHVRRGDFIDLNWNINMDYYKKAINIIYKNIIDPIFYIFSDDEEFVKKYFKDLENKIIVNNNKGKYSYIDMQLMSLCKYNIIANSTFSTWGAILNKNKNKIVIAPKMIKYFESHILSKDSKYIYI